ncbi:MAG: hypothetical protein H8E41_02170, partial [Desulfobulbaceae bacterium]|nr:hypothetical protein [Candidatus Desulfobia pelagia]
MTPKKSIPALTALLVLLSFVLAAAGEYANTRALSQLTEVKVYYDVNIGNPAKLTTRLMLIDKTYKQLI